jgi:DNA-directed RNA polymerase subunit alpha
MLKFPEEVKVITKEDNRAVFEISPLMPGYGATIANPLRRVLLSSLEGAAITSIKIKGIDHEFFSIPGIMEDIMQIILNVKKIRLRSFSNEPVTLTLTAKKEGEILAKDIKLSSDVELVNPNQLIATITEKKTSLSMELTIEKGVGYVPTEERQKEKLPIGVIAVDAIFSPVRMVNFKIEDMRVGEQIDYNKITLEVETDGTMEPEAAVKNAAEILMDHLKIVSQIKVNEKATKPKKKRTKKS